MLFTHCIYRFFLGHTNVELLRRSLQDQNSDWKHNVLLQIMLNDVLSDTPALICLAWRGLRLATADWKVLALHPFSYHQLSEDTNNFHSNCVCLLALSFVNWTWCWNWYAYYLI